MAGTDPAATPDPAAHAAGHNAAGHSDQAGHENPDVETWEPHFTFHGFQFVEFTAQNPVGDCHLIDDKLSHGTGVVFLAIDCHLIDDKLIHSYVRIIGCVINSAKPPAGRFECSHAGVNRL
jgi:alpha-L-rhamnosidase